ncbi:MAG: tRNA (guanine(46)-N(7))-methyltransferase TrmB [Opitutaceae bacterium]
MPLNLHRGILEERRRRLADLCRTLPSRPFVLEIGSGHGHFLTAHATAHPEMLHVGIDLLPDRIARAERKRERASLTNLRFIRAHAEDFLASLPPAVRFHSIFILFPDPWPKRRHHKNRLLRPDILAELATRTGQGARLHFRTDHAPYFEEARTAISASPFWRPVEASWPFDLPTVFQQRAPSFESLIAERQPD